MADVRFVQGFLGRFVRNEPDGTPQLIERALGESSTPLKRGDHAVHAFGMRQETMALVVEGDAAVCVKGRPYPADGAGSATLGGDAIERELAALDGRFALCLLGSNRLVLATDILGASAVFYHVDPEHGILFSSHLGLLVRSMSKRPSLDQMGVVGILAGSCMVGDRTPYQNIRRLRAGQYLLAEKHGGATTYRVANYLDPVEDLIGSHPADAGNDEMFESLIVSAVARAATSTDIGLMLSGGKDSQTLALALLLGGRQVRSFTFGEWRSSDLRAAKRFASALGIEHQAIDYSSWDFKTYADAVVELAAGASGLQVAHHLVAYDRLRGRVALALVGFLGDAITGAHLPQSGQTVLDIVLPFRRNWHPDLRAAYAEELRQLEAEVEQYWRDTTGLHEHQRSQLTDLVVRQGTWISSSFDVCDWFVPLSFPFFSRHLIRFWLNQPIGNLQGQRLYSEWVADRFSRVRASRRRTSSLSTRMYEGIQQALDYVDAATKRAPAVAVVDWRDKLASSASWLDDLSRHTTDDRLRRVLPAQLHHGSGHYPALLAAGLAFAAK
jgi:hypothetical protein